MLQLYDLSHVKLHGLVNYKDLKRERNLDGNEVLSFSYPQNDDKYQDIKEETYIKTKENEYVIKEINIEDEWTEFVAKVNVEDLKGKPFSHFESVENLCADTINLALAGTGWTIGSCDVTKKRTVRKANCSSYDILQEIRKVYRCDFRFDALNKEVYIYQSRGSDKGAYFTDELNLKKLGVQSNSYDYCTRIISIGKDGLKINDVNGGKEYVENYQYSSKVITIYWEDNRYSRAESLKADAEERLSELSKPVKAYSADMYDLARLNDKYKNILDYDLGDTITLVSKDKKVKDKQRIVKIIEYPDESERNSCEIANRTLRLEDMQAETLDTADTVSSITTSDGMIDNSKVDFNPLRVEVTTLVAQKADIGSLNAAVAKIGTLEATVVYATDFNAYKATIDTALINKATIIALNASNGRITTLESRAASIDNLLAGNLSAKNIQSGFITATSGLIANGAISNAMIADLDAGKIKTGKLYTNLVTVQSSSGNMLISDNTIQIKDASRVRVQIGKDASNDYNMYVWDSTGNLMFDATGLKTSGIKSKIIRDDMVSDTANISGQKININSLLGTINMTKTIVDGTDTSIIYTGNWGIENNAGFYGGTAKYSSNLNDKIQYTFTGIGINIYFVKSPGSGIAEILIDGVSKGTFDCYAASSTFNVLGFSTNTLPNGTHTVTINVTHIKNASATNYYVEFDYFEVIKLGNTSTLSSSKVYIDTQAQTLDVAFTSLSSTVTNQGSTITNQGTAIGTLQGQISSKIWRQDITTSVNNIQIGTRNLLKQSNTAILDSWHNEKTLVSELSQGTDDGNYIKVTAISDGSISSYKFIGTYMSKKLDLNKSYIVSAEFKTNGTFPNAFYIRSEAIIAPHETFTKPIPNTNGKWQRESLTFMFTKDFKDILIAMYGPCTAGTYIMVRNYKIEEGNKATDYSQAPEDTDAQITTISNNYTSLNQTVNGISANVSSQHTAINDLGTKMTNAESDITALNKSIVLKVTQTDIDTSISNVQFGGRNLINTAYVPNAVNASGSDLTVVPYTYNGIDGYRLKKTTNANWGSYLVWWIINKAIKDIASKYSFSIYAVNLDASKPINISSFFANGSSANTMLNSAGQVVSNVGKRYKFENLSVYPDYDTTKADTAWHFNVLTVCDIFIAQPKLESGTKCTDYTPALEDVKTQIDTATTRITTAEGNITTLSNSINLKVSTADFNTLTGKVNNTEASIGVLQGQIVNKVEVNGVKSIISQSATEVQSAFNGATGLFTIKNGNLVLKNASSVNVMWVDTAGLLTTNKLHVYGDSNNVLIDGTGHKGVDLNSTNGGDCYIQFNNGSYSARIQSTSSAPNALVFRGSGGIQVEGDIYTQAYVKAHGINGQASQPLELNRYGGNGQTIVCNGNGSGGGGGLNCGSFYASGNATVSGTIFAGDIKYNSGNLALWAPNITHLYNVSSSNYLAIYDTNGTTYGATIWASDARLKNCIANSTKSALDDVMRIQHRQFNWNSTGEHCDIGYISQELMAINSNLIFGVPQENGSLLYHPKVDVLVPLLSKAIQELKKEKDAEIENLKEQINILKNLLEKV